MRKLAKLQSPEDFENLGYQTMLETRDFERAREICALELHAHSDELLQQANGLRRDQQQAKNQALSLHAHLYDRPEAVSDADMLSHQHRIWIFSGLAVLTGLASLIGNGSTFYFLGSRWWVTLIAAVGFSGLAITVMHQVYDLIVANRKAQIAVALLVAALFFAGFYRLSQARNLMAAHDLTAADPSLYVDDPTNDSSPGNQPSTDGFESRVRGMLAGAFLLIMLAADVTLGLLVSGVLRMRNHQDYTAWQELKKLMTLINRLEGAIAELLARVEIAKKRCMAGMLRGQNAWNRRRPPYHKFIVPVVLYFAVLFSAAVGHTQTYRGILIDSSQSIQHAGPQDELFRESLLSAKKLLLSTPPDSKVWVSLISTDSFGGTHEILKGWTPEAHGVFTDDLNRARRQLAAGFVEKSKELVPAEQGTDIFGGLWKLKTSFESSPASATTKEIWIFSDMVNETAEFNMRELLEQDPEQMLDRAKANGLVLPLSGYKVYIYGAATDGVSPHAWMTVKQFWTMYLHAAGAQIAAYSADCDFER